MHFADQHLRAARHGSGGEPVLTVSGCRTSKLLAAGLTQGMPFLLNINGRRPLRSAEERGTRLRFDVGGAAQIVA